MKITQEVIIEVENFIDKIDRLHNDELNLRFDIFSAFREDILELIRKIEPTS